MRAEFFRRKQTESRVPGTRVMRVQRSIHRVVQNDYLNLLLLFKTYLNARLIFRFFSFNDLNVKRKPAVVQCHVSHTVFVVAMSKRLELGIGGNEEFSE